MNKNKKSILQLSTTSHYRVFADVRHNVPGGIAAARNM